MRVTALSFTKRGRVSLHLDGEYRLTLHPEAAGSLSVGQELDEDTLAELVGHSERLLAKAKALELLSRRSYSAEMLYQKLGEHVEEEAARAAVERMVELGLVDDEDYARRYAADCVQRRGMSPSRALRELSAKGIDRELAEEALSRLEEDPEAAIARVVKKKYLRLLGDEKGMRRTYGALVRLGYRYCDIRAALGHLQEDEDYYE